MLQKVPLLKLISYAYLSPGDLLKLLLTVELKSKIEY